MKRCHLLLITIIFQVHSIYSQDIQRDTNSIIDEKIAINELLDNWHHAAAIADENVFFGSMADNCIYLGTDPSERWSKEEFIAWGMKYFERESAWEFKTVNRVIMLSEESDYAWFDELLDTWMGTCRGSGVLRKFQDNQWKIMHYNLTVTVPNEKIRDFVKLIQGEDEDEK